MRFLYIIPIALVLAITTGCSKDKDSSKGAASDGKDKGSNESKADSKATTGASDKDDPKAKSSGDDKTGDVPFKRYKVKSGMIEYAVSGMQTGTEVLYFDDWGWKEAIYVEVETNVGGHKSKENAAKIMDQKYSHNFDVVTRKGIRVSDPLAALIAGAKTAGKDMTDVGMHMMKAMGGKKTGTKKVAGLECDVYEMKSLRTTTCVHQGLTLETVSNMANMGITKVATKAELDVDVPKDKFVVPDDIEFRDMKSPM